MKILLLLLSLNVMAQESPKPFLSLGIGSGAVLQAGVFYKKWEGVGEIKKPFTSNTQYGTAGFAVGRKLFNWVTPSIGIAYWENTDFKKYEQDPLGRTGFISNEGVAMFYGLELRHTWWFTKYSYIKNSYFTFGVKLHKKWENY